MKFTHNNTEYELILLHLAGSKLYGNSTPQSDTDYRGVFIAPKETKLGLIGKVEQLEGKDVWKSLAKAGLKLEETDDIVIYELNRFATLASDNNPNIMDTLCFDYNKSEFTIYASDKGKELIDSKSLFLSSKLKFTFSGYAISQLSKVRSRDKYLTKYPRISEVLDYIKSKWLNNEIDWDWICRNFGGEVAAFITGETAQKHTFIPKVNYPTWDSFKEDSGIEDIDRYRIPQMISYCHAKDLKGKSQDLNCRNYVPDTYYHEKNLEELTLQQFLYESAAFREFSPSMLAIYTGGNGIFTVEGKLKSSPPEHIGEFVCLLSIDQNKFKSDRDFNTAMWEWKCKRNEARSELEKQYGYDTKNVSHLVRLMEQAKCILKTGDYNPTLSGERLQLVKDTRAGKFTYEEVIKYAEENDKELDELYKVTTLQKKPDIKRINNLVLKLQGV